MQSDSRLCMIGAGRHASHNVYPAFSQLANAQVVANCDIIIDKARSVARQHGIATSYADYDEMLGVEKPDGVVVCVGPDFHARTAIDLMQKGFHVYTEKPPAVSAAQCRQVLAVQQQTQKICMTGFKKRYAPAYLKAKRIIDSEEFGAPSLLSIFRTSANYGNTADPRSQYLLDSAIHAIDLAVFLYGRVSTVSATRKMPASFAIQLHFENEAVGTLALTDRMSYQRGWEQVKAVGTGGVCIETDNAVEMLAFHLDQPIAAHKPEFVAGTSNSLHEMGFVSELQSFVDALRSGTQPSSTIEESTHTMAVIEAIQASVESRSVIPVAGNSLPDESVLDESVPYKVESVEGTD